MDGRLLHAFYGYIVKEPLFGVPFSVMFEVNGCDVALVPQWTVRVTVHVSPMSLLVNPLVRIMLLLGSCGPIDTTPLVMVHGSDADPSMPSISTYA